MSCKCDTINIVNDNNVIVVSHADGRDGKSAYQQAVEGGYTGTEQEFNCTLSLLADVAEGKKQIVNAINTKGGNSTPDESFQQLAEDIQTLPYAGISAEGIVQTEEFSFLNFICGNILNGIEEIDSNVSGVLPNLFKNSTIRKVRMPFLTDMQKSCFSNSALEEFDSETLSYISTESSFSDCYFLKKVRMPNLVRISNYTFQKCTALKEISLPRLKDTGQDILRTLRLGWLAYVTQENIDYANSKGWTLTT